MNGLDLLWEFAATLFQTLIVDTIIEDVFINGIVAGIRDQLVSLFTNNILGIAGPLWAFIIIIMLGALVMVNRWGQHV